MIEAATDLLWRTYEKWRVDGAPQIAAALTYYVFLSLAPLLVLLVGVLGRYFGRSSLTGRVFEQARVLAGPLGEQVVREIVSAAKPSTLGVAASVAAVVIAVSGTMQMFRQLRIAFDRMWSIPPEESPGGGVWAQLRWALSAMGRENLAAFVIVLAVGALLVASLVLSGAIAVAAQMLAPVLHVGVFTLRALDSAISAAMMTVLFAIVYRYLPRTSVGWNDVWVGALMTSVLFLIGRLLLGIYFTRASPGSAYGAAGSVVALLVWTNLSLQLLLFGAEFTHVWAATRGTHATRKLVTPGISSADG